MAFSGFRIFSLFLYLTFSKVDTFPDLTTTASSFFFQVLFKQKLLNFARWWPNQVFTDSCQFLWPWPCFQGHWRVWSYNVVFSLLVLNECQLIVISLVHRIVHNVKLIIVSKHFSVAFLSALWHSLVCFCRTRGKCWIFVPSIPISSTVGHRSSLPLDK